MNKELLGKTVEIFDTQDKWDALFEIQSELGNITDYWLAIGAKELRASFSNDPNWTCVQWEDQKRDTRWYITEDGMDSVGIGIGWPAIELHLFLDTDRHSPVSVERYERTADLLRETKFEALLKQLDLKTPFNKYVQDGSFAFNSVFNPINGEADPTSRQRCLAWAAGHPEKSEYVDQVGDYIRRLTDNTDLTALFRELNKRVKASN